jgi:hypothetical protein
MDKDDPLQIARLIAQEIMTDHGRTPVERVLRRHSQSVRAWREQGWTWGQIAALLTKGSLRLKDDTAITERYLAAVFSRIRAKAKPPPHAGASPGSATDHPAAPSGVTKNRPVAAVSPAGKPRQPSPAQGQAIGKEQLRARMAAAAKARSDEI